MIIWYTTQCSVPQPGRLLQHIYTASIGVIPQANGAALSNFSNNKKIIVVKMIRAHANNQKFHTNDPPADFYYCKLLTSNTN